jgi:hypothetical protein
MSDNFRVIEQLIKRKGRSHNPFFLMAAFAIRETDQKLGLLLQHQRRLHGRLKKQGPSNGFFVKQEDLLIFLELIEQLFMKKSDKLSYSIRRKTQNVFGSNSSLSLAGLIDELGSMSLP